MLGFFITGHPLDRYRDVVMAFGPAHSMNLREHQGRSVEMPCVVTSVSKNVSRKDGSEWGKVTVEDFHGTATVLAFGDTWQETKKALRQDAVVLVRGKVSSRERDEEDPPIFLDDAERLEEVPRSGRIAVEIELEAGASGELGGDAFQRARRVFEDHPGEAPVEIVVGNGVPVVGEEDGDGAGSGNGAAAEGSVGEPHSPQGDPGPARFRSRSLRVEPDEETLAELKEIFGPARVQLVRAGRDG